MVEILNQIDAFVWGPAMIVLLLGSISFSLSVLVLFRNAYLRQLDVTHQKKVTRRHFAFLVHLLSHWRQLLAPDQLSVLLPVLAGGPGAVFWMWLTGIFGIATKYSEIFVAIKYRVKDHNGSVCSVAPCMLGSVALQNGKVLAAGTQN